MATESYRSLYWLTDEQMARLLPYLPKSRGKPRVDDKWGRLASVLYR